MPTAQPDVTGTDWTAVENDILVADYFAMLGDELAGRPYVKAHHRRNVVAAIGRSEGSVERKYMNVSAVLVKLGLPRIRGYAPNVNAQFKALTDAIDRYLSQNSPAFEPTAIERPEGDPEELFVPLPELKNRPDKVPEPIRRLVRKWDPAERDARNRALGKTGEGFVVEVEERRLLSAGRKDLMKAVRWVSDLDGDGAGYDVLSFDAATGERRLIEVKTTFGDVSTPFYLTRNEESLSREAPSEFRLYRVFDLSVRPRIMAVQPPLDHILRLQPTTWIARFQTVDSP